MAPARAEEVLRLLRRQNIPIDWNLWLALAMSYVSSGDGTGAEDVLGRAVRELPEMGPVVPVLKKTLIAVIDDDVDMVESLDELAMVAGSLGSAVVPGDIPALARALAGDDTAEIERILASADGFPPQLVASGWEWLVSSYALRDADEAERTLDRMAEAGIPATADHWARVIAAHDRDAGWSGAWAAFERARHRGVAPNEAMWVNLADSAAGSQGPGPGMVVQIIDEAAAAGQPVTTPLWNSLLWAYAVHEPDLTSDALDAMAARGLAPDARSWLFLGMAESTAPGPRTPEALEAAVSAYERGLELSPHDTNLMSGLLFVAQQLERDDIATDMLRRLVQLARPDRVVGFETALRRLEPLLGSERSARLVALLGQSPGNADWPFRVFRDTLRTLEADYGTIAPLLMAFPDLMQETDAFSVVEHTTTGRQQGQALDVLARVYPAIARDRAAQQRARPRQIAGMITGHDLLAVRSIAQLETDAQAGDFDAAEYLGHYEHAAGNVDRAREWYARLLEIDPVEETVRTAISGLESDIEHRDQYLRDLEAAVEQGNGRAAYYLGELQASDGRLADAKITWLRAAELGSPQAPGGLATLCVELREDDEAERWARRAAGLGDPGGFDVLGFLLADRGQLDEAERMYRNCLEAGGTVGARRRLAWILLRTQRADEGMAMLVEAVEHGDVDAACDLCQLAVGDDEAHRAWMRRAAELGDAESAATLGRDLLRDGRTTEAEYWLARAAASGAAIAGAARP